MEQLNRRETIGIEAPINVRAIIEANLTSIKRLVKTAPYFRSTKCFEVALVYEQKIDVAAD